MYSSVYVTASNEGEAEKIASFLLEKRLVACANILPVRSMYWWKGKIEKEPEAAVIFKTRDELVDEVISGIETCHSYEVPCIVSWPIKNGNPAYLDWIGEETR
jgi:periplasmic divalent cation tolerance protein